MYYRVKAKLKTSAAIDLFRKLKDNTISAQRPDGKEIVDSMNRAVLTAAGYVEWSEVCYCQTPLLHERVSVYDKHFDDLTTEEIDTYEKYEGRPFMEYLANLTDGKESLK